MCVCGFIFCSRLALFYISALIFYLLSFMMFGFRCLSVLLCCLSSSVCFHLVRLQPSPPPAARRGRSMSVCVPCFPCAPAPSYPPKLPSTPPPVLSPRSGMSDGETFAGRLSKALECVLPRRRASLPALFASPVCLCVWVKQEPPDGSGLGFAKKK